MIASDRALWMIDANCRGCDPNLFYPEHHDGGLSDEVRATCGACVVRVECLDYAVRHLELGVWGGTSERERRVVRRHYRRHGVGVVDKRLGRVS